MRSILVWSLLVLGLSAFGAGCGDSPQPEADAAQQPDGGSDTGTDADVGTDPDSGDDTGDNPAPTAEFSAAQTAVAGTAVAFDASSSSDPDGEALTYDWDFGDETLGDGQSIAHIFAQAGDYTVTLTVTDPRGQQHSAQQTIVVDPRPQPAAQDVGALTVGGRIVDSGGAALENIEVSVLRTDVDGVTDADGFVELNGLDADTEHTVVVKGDGYANQVVVVETPAGATDAYFETMLLAQSDATSLGDVEAGGATDPGVDGASLTLPPNALVDANGESVTGQIDVRMTPVDISGDQISAFPGSFDAVQSDGTSTSLLSYGAVEFDLSQGGAPLQLAAGKEATVLVPIYVPKNKDGDDLAAGDSIPLWSLDESTGIWVREGSGTVVASSESPSGWAFRAKVGHFSWWNCDAFFNPYRVNPMPRLRDNNGDPTVELPDGETALVLGRGIGDGRPRGSASVYVDSTGVDDGLRIPADRDTRLIAIARNGTLRGEKLANGAEGAFDDIVIPLDPIDSGGNGEMVTLPVQRDAAIDPADQVDRYTFTASAGDRVRVGVGQANGSNLRGRVSLYPSGGIRMGVATFGSSPGGIVDRIPSDGDYIVEVAATANAPGAYSLSVETLGEVQLDSHVSGTFDSDGQQKFFLLEATAGTQVALGTKAGRATYAFLQTVEGDNLVNSYSGNVAEIPSDGFYILLLENNDSSTMDYEVGLAAVESTPLSFTDSRATNSSTIDIRGDHQIYSFSADAEDGLVVSLRGTGANALVDDRSVEMGVERVGTGSVFRPEADVQNAAGYNPSDYFISTHQAKLPGAGADTYVVTVSSQILGDYELVVDRVAHAAQITVDDDVSCAGATTSSLSAALHAIDSGGTVDVCDGSYRSDVHTILPTDGITVEGASQSGVIVETRITGGVTLDIRASNVTVRNMTFEHADGYAIRSEGDNLVFEDLTVRATDSAVDILKSGIDTGGINPTFRNLTISEADTGIKQLDPGVTGGVVEDSVFTDVNTGMQLEAKGYTIQRNTIDVRQTGANFKGLWVEGSGFVIEDNVITLDLQGSSNANGTAIRIQENLAGTSSTTIRGNSMSYLNEHRSQDTVGIFFIVNHVNADPTILVENNHIQLKPTNGGNALEFFPNVNTEFTFQNNVVTNMGYNGIELRYADRATHIGIYNNTFQHAAIDTHSSSTNDSIRVYVDNVAAANVEIVNNIFDANGVGAYGIEFMGAAQGMSVDSDYNLWFGYLSEYLEGTSSTGTNEITGLDPQFQSGSLELTATSPAVDAGADTSIYPNVPALDFSGTSRPAGAGHDIGAYEQ
jgi:hypothetical protein